MPTRIAILILVLAAAQAADLHVMPLGDSLTAMFRYQPVVRERLAAAGTRCVFVGSQTYGGQRHEGHPGWNTARVLGSVRGWLDAAQPDVVLLQVGTNDMYHGYGTQGRYATSFPHDPATMTALAPMVAVPPAGGSWLDALGRRIGQPAYAAALRTQCERLVDAILDHPARPALVVALIPPVGRGHPSYPDATDGCTARIREFNAGLAAIVAARRSAGRRVVLSDHFDGVRRGHGAVPAASDFGDAAAQSRDWVHPAAGAIAWRSMGERFAAATLAVTTVHEAPSDSDAGDPPGEVVPSEPAGAGGVAGPPPGAPAPAAPGGGGGGGCGGGGLTGIALMMALALAAGRLRSGRDG